MTWHLHYVFEKTIRADPNNRYANASVALEEAEKVKNRIAAGFLPLEILDTNICPVCGIGKFIDAPQFWDNTLIDPQTFTRGEQDKQVIRALHPFGNAWGAFLVCPYCGFAAVCADVIRKRALENRKKLE
jgi:hypothetical protein